MQENYSNWNSNDYSNIENINIPQQQFSQIPQYGEISQQEKVSNFISQTSPTKNLEKIDKILRGFFFDQEQRKWIKVTHGIPEQMRMDYMQFLTPYLSEDVRMGRMDRVSINNIMIMVIEWSLDYLDAEADNYYLDPIKNEYTRIQGERARGELIRGSFKIGISEEQLSKIHYLVCSAVAFALWRAENGVERDRMYGSLKLGDDFSNYAKQEEKKSLISSILPWK